MPVQPISFGLESRPGRFGPEGGARLTNAFAEQLADDAKAPWALYCRPGLKNLAMLLGVGGYRGGIDLGAVAYVINGVTVNKVDAGGDVTNIGTFLGSKPAFMARNRKSPNPQIAVVSDGLKSIIAADVVTPIADTDLPPPIGVDSIGGYFVFAIADGRYFWTTIDEGTEIDALDFASAEANPDGLLGVVARTEEIVLLGSKSIEFHALTGSTSVFQRVQQTTLLLGCLSAAAWKLLNGVPIGPTSDGTVRMLDAYSPERISNHDVERAIRELSDPTSLTAQTFSLDGHQYYCLNSPTWTWACDLLNRKWYEWSSYGLGRWRAEGFVSVGGKMAVGDYATGKLYEIGADTNDDAGDHLVWKLVSGPVGAYPGRIIADELFLDLIPGAGLNSTDDEEKDPKVMLRVSDDDGKSWSNQMVQSVGKIGDYKRAVSFMNLGASGEAGFRFEISMSAPVARCLQRAALRYTPLNP